ncbi:MAG: hypothetical protein QOJ98_1803 [Acidobacteriota bacterium]|nr:hypothetical protein [Acidobacteriota bacterium]
MPVVGQDLLTITRPLSESIPLRRYLADVVSSRLGLQRLADGAADPLSTLACQVVRARTTNDFHFELYDAMAEIESDSSLIPQALLQLARITDFRLFLSTTFDHLLGRAIDAVRFDGRPETETLSFSPYGTDDLTSSDRTRPTVFHLLGRLQFPGQYAVTEEETLEFVHALQSPGKRPARLFGELDQKHLLIIGSGFSDWLARFFIRTAKTQRLWPERQPGDYVADSAVGSQKTLTEFLQQFSGSTRLFSLEAEAFVHELYQRWSNRRKASVYAGQRRSEPPPMNRGAVFLSYASEDRPFAENLAAKLRAADLDVWFDRDELEPGDPWENKILLNISKAAAFIAVISRNTLTRQQKFFRVEWEHAVDVAIRFPSDYRFLFPLSIDDTVPDHPSIPRQLHDRQWSATNEGEPDPAFVRALVETYKSYQREVIAGG